VNSWWAVQGSNL